MIGAIIFGSFDAGLFGLVALGIALPIMDTVRERRIVRAAGQKC